MPKRRQPLLLVTVVLFVVIMVAWWNRPGGWWIGICFLLAGMGWFLRQAFLSWNDRQSDPSHRLDHTYDFVTSCFALCGTLTLLAGAILQRKGISPTPAAMAGALLFSVFYVIAVPMRIKLGVAKRRGKRAQSGVLSGELVKVQNPSE